MSLTVNLVVEVGVEPKGAPLLSEPGLPALHLPENGSLPEVPS